MTSTLQDSLSALLQQKVSVLVTSPGDQQPPAAGGIPPEQLRQEIQALEDAIQAIQENLAQLQEALEGLEVLAERSQP